MLQLTNVSKSYGVQTILEVVSFGINHGERVGLVGPNGCGKTTLLRLIAGLEAPDGGLINVEPSVTLGYLPQGQELTFGDTLGAVVRFGLAEVETTRQELDRLRAQMAHDASAELLEAYGTLEERFEALGGYEAEHRVQEVLAGLDLANVDMQTPVERLSGGQRTRLGLVRLLLSQPTLLLLDEPTNHLDVDALEWLEHFLNRYRGSALIVSHDRTFLDRTVTRILELDDQTHRVTVYAGHYSDYEAAKARELEKQWAAWKDQQAEIDRLQTAAAHLRGIAKFRKGGKADTNDKFAKGFFANRALETTRRAKQIERRVEHMLTDEKVDKPQGRWQLKLEFGGMPRSGQIVLTLEEVGQRFDEAWLFRRVGQTLRHGARIALMGPNGSGKTTLLRILTGELTPSEGSVRLGSNVRVGYMPQEQENLDPAATPLSLIRALAPMDETQARHLLHFFLFEGDEVFARIGELSYGERARLLLAKLVVSRANLLVLDEPINHLDIPSRERFESALDAFPGTILVAAHDRAFVDRFATGIWALAGGTLRLYPDREAMKKKQE